MRLLTTTSISRRRLIQSALVASGATVLTPLIVACGGSDATPTQGSTSSGAGSTSASTSTSATGGTSASPAASGSPSSSSAATSTAPAQASGPATGTAVIAQKFPLTDIDSTIQNGVQPLCIAIHVTEPLLFRADTGELQPLLAERFEYVDPTHLRMTIRQGVKHHNGDDFSVDDVVFTIQRVLDPETKSLQARYMQSVTGAEAVDDTTVEIQLSTSDATILDRLSLLPMISKRAAQELGAEFSSKLVGTGPYKFVSWQKGGRVTLEVFPGYWREPARIKTLQFAGIGEDSTRMAGLKTGELNVIDYIPPDYVPQLKDSSNVTVSQVTGLRSSFAIFNVSKKPFDDVRMRQAANYAVNKQDIVDGVFNGYAVAVDQPFGPNVFGYDPSLENHYPYDPDKAKSLMAEAGYADGVDVNMVINIDDQSVAEPVVDQLGKVGIRVKQKVLDFNGLANQYLTLKEPSPELDIVLFDNANNTAEANYNLALNFSSLAKKGRGLYWSDPEVDEWIVQGREETDRNKRLEIYHRIVQKMAETAAMIPLIDPDVIYGSTKNLTDWKPRSDQLIYLYGASITS